jgi:hypothetical protein
MKTMTIWHAVNIDIDNKNASSLKEDFFQIKQPFLDGLYCIQEAYRRPNQHLWVPQEFRDQITSKLLRRLDCLGLPCCRQLIALSENQTCITRNDHRDARRPVA